MFDITNTTCLLISSFDKSPFFLQRSDYNQLRIFLSCVKGLVFCREVLSAVMKLIHTYLASGISVPCRSIHLHVRAPLWSLGNAACRLWIWVGHKYSTMLTAPPFVELPAINNWKRRYRWLWRSSTFHKPALALETYLVTSSMTRAWMIAALQLFEISSALFQHGLIIYMGFWTVDSLRVLTDLIRLAAM